MLSIKRVRELIDGGEKYTDEEIERIRDDLRFLAELALDDYIEKKKQSKQE